MPLQNRVHPSGEIFAVPRRGTMMGNRGGKFHRDDKTLGKRRWASTHWICCDLHFKNAHHEAMGQGFTSLFFLDEVTALAAGHRPCFYCRRAEAKAFLQNRRVEVFDRQLHTERLEKAHHLMAVPVDGAMVEHEGAAYAIKADQMLLWSFHGYQKAIPLMPRAKVLTPPSIIAILASGYKPRWHASAQKWDAT